MTVLRFSSRTATVPLAFVFVAVWACGVKGVDIRREGRERRRGRGEDRLVARQGRENGLGELEERPHRGRNAERDEDVVGFDCCSL